MPDSNAMLSGKSREIKVTLAGDKRHGSSTFANPLQITNKPFVVSALLSHDVKFIFTSNEFGHVGSESHKICCIWRPLVIPEFK